MVAKANPQLQVQPQEHQDTGPGRTWQSAGWTAVLVRHQDTGPGRIRQSAGWTAVLVRRIQVQTLGYPMSHKECFNLCHPLQRVLDILRFTFLTL